MSKGSRNAAKSSEAAALRMARAERSEAERICQYENYFITGREEAGQEG